MIRIQSIIYLNAITPKRFNMSYPDAVWTLATNANICFRLSPLSPERIMGFDGDNRPEHE